MIQKLQTGRYRVRYEFGINKYYKRLKKQEKILTAKIEKLVSKKKHSTKEYHASNKELEDVLKTIKELEAQYGSPVNILTRRSFNCKNLWQAKEIEKLFKDAHNFETVGEMIPSYLEKQLSDIEDAPFRLDFLEEIAYQLASICAFNPELIKKIEYDIFLSQADINLDWLEKFNISEKEVKSLAFSVSCDKESISLKNKTFLFTGAFVSYTVCEEYVRCLHTLTDKEKIDGIIVVGPWIKYLFLHKTSKYQKVLSSVKKLAEKVPIYAIRSNTESAELIPELKALGINFVNKIEDKNNLFLSHQFSKTSKKDQLNRFRDYAVDKNIYVYTTYVAFETQLRENNIRYLVGSGSSSHHTPSARIWSRAYDSSRFNSEKFDNLGGHILRFDSQTNVFPTAFYYNDKTKAIFSNGKIYTKTEVINGKLHVLLSDLHAQSMNISAFGSLISFLKQNKNNIKSIIITGDFLDNAVLCHHSETKIKKQYDIKKEHKSFLHEIAYTREVISAILNAVRDNLKDIDLVYKVGNHDVNSINKLVNKPIAHFLNTMLDLDSLLELSEKKFKIIDERSPYKLGDITILHGHELTKARTSQVFSNRGVRGHSHQACIGNYGTTLPTLQKFSAATYIPYRDPNWSLGWGVMTGYNNVVEKPELILINNEKYYDYAKIAKVQKDFSLKLPKNITINYSLN